jgi:hypothetical protein
MTRISVVAGASAAALLAAMAHSDTVLRTGPSSSATPYVVGVPGSPVREVVSILTVGDSIGGYVLVGIPDGMGGFMAGDAMQMYVNHEVTASEAVGRRAHQPEGFSGGAFISGWTVNPLTLEITAGFDAMTSTATVSNGTGGSLYNFARFCAGGIASTSAYFNPATGLGTMNRFYICGEESGAGGRMIATDLVTGVGYQIPAFDPSAGSWENGVARPMESDQTVLIGLSDGAANRVFVYVGTKQADGNSAERAGLLNGTSYGIQVQVDGVNVMSESRDFGFASAAPAVFSGTFTLAEGGTAAGTSFLRPEDGDWDPANPTDFYFVTTDRMSTTSTGNPQSHGSRLYRLRFSDVNNPLAGGTIEAVLDGSDVMEMGDNLCVFNTIQGGTRVVIQEDPGNHPHSAKHLIYDAQADSVEVILQSDPARFGDIGVAATAPFNRDEEVSGVFDARDTLGLGWFVGNIQAHYSLAAPLIQGGQLYAFFAPELVGSCDADVGVVDGMVDASDITALLSAWGNPGRTDINQDGTTNGADLTFLLSAWGSCSN